MNFLGGLLGGVVGVLSPILSIIDGSAIHANDAAFQAQKQQARTQSLQEQYKLVNDRIKTIDKTVQQIDYNQAVAANRGFRANSPSFNATQVGVFNTGATALHNKKVAENISKMSYENKVELLEKQRQAREQQIYQSTLFSGASLIFQGFSSGIFSGATKLKDVV